MIGPALPVETPDLPGVGIPADDWPAYFGATLSGDLIDPQQVLSGREREDREEFLRQHADDSKIGLKVMVFEADQRLPTDVDELVAGRLPTGAPTAVVLYRMGEPTRAELVFSEDLRAELPITEAGRMVGQAARAAEEKVGDLDQFKEFCLQISIRLYWIERSLGWIDETEEGAFEEKPEPVSVVSRSELVRESFRSAWKIGGLPLLVCCSAFISFLVLRFVIRSRRRYRFPEFEIDPRLGGAHGAGIGAVISFGNTTQSPSAQKSPTVDCLGGI
jgi:hypothetical protein